MAFIPYGKQFLDQSDIDAVIEVLNSDYLTTGPKVKEFERALASYCDADYCVGSCKWYRRTSSFFISLIGQRG